jgi:serine/threonine-protein kinase HipA
VKFDGVHGNRDKEVADPQGFGRIEYAYSLMAREAGIDMEACRLHEEGGRAHFMTRRFDRSATGQKLHMQSLGALMHYDFNIAGGYAYEQALQAIRRLDLPMADIEQQARRAFFNVVARNQDDHVKNIAFLMDRKGLWRLSPAFDMAYAFNSSGAWTGQHQMSLNAKRDAFEVEDLIAFAGSGGLKRLKARSILSEVSSAVRRWRSFANEAGVADADTARIERAHRRDLFA